MKINVVGGTYFEECFEPHWREIYGSGLRGSLTILGLGDSVHVELHTFGDSEAREHLNYLGAVYDKLSSNVKEIEQSLTFKYDHPLADPLIYPRLDTLTPKENRISVEAENIVLYGTLDGIIDVKGDKVVYDPQSPVNPIPFRKTGSVANQLVIITNYSEAVSYTKKSELSEIKKVFFEIENLHGLIIKDGPKGAYVIDKTGEQTSISAYRTNNVWSIGSGDVFTASFAYHWIVENMSLVDAARNASKNTAQYCESKQLNFDKLIESKLTPVNYIENKSATIYLAGPFFNFPQRWLVQQFRAALRSMNINVFSPWHEIGYGLAKDVVPLDIEALDRASLVLAIVDGLDSGTLFEIGYARAKGIPVVAYVQNESPEALLMLEGTNCTIFSDMTTAVYNASWLLSTNE
jgi:hypothetical protein